MLSAGRSQSEGAVRSQPAVARTADFLLILAGGVLLGALLALAGLAPTWFDGPAGGLLYALRIPLALVYVLYVPGYLLQALFFPATTDLDVVERIGLSLGLSIALLVLLALLLDRLPWGLRIGSVLIGQAALVLLLLVAAAWQRLRQPAGQAYLPSLRPRRWWAGLPSSERRLLFAITAALLLTALVAAWIFLTPSPNSFMTEFYMLGSEGLAENYPRQGAVGQPLQVTIGITNRERQAQTYRVEAWVQDNGIESRRQQVAAIAPLTLEPGETSEKPLAWRMPWAGQDQQVEFLLFRDLDPKPYRRLRLFLNIESSG